MTNRIAIIANPVTDISSAKFLLKLSRMLGTFCPEIYVVNDGRASRGDSVIRTIATTSFNARLSNSGTISSLLAFALAQIGQFLGLMKCLKQVESVFVFPVTMTLSVLLARVARKKIVLYEAQDVLWEYSNKSFFQQLRYFLLYVCRNSTLHFCDTIIVEGKSVIKQNLLSPLQSKTIVMGNFVNTTNYCVKKTIDKRENIIGFVATISRRKGILEFVNATHRLCQIRDDLKFVIVGKGPLSDVVKEALAPLISRGKVRILDAVPEKMFSNFLNDLKLLVLPSLSEGLPNSILEAMACGTPVLATAVGAIPDVIVDQVNGFLMKDNSSDCIATSILQTIDNINLQHISHSARICIEREYSYSVGENRYRTIFS